MDQQVQLLNLYMEIRGELKTPYKVLSEDPL